jgi:hypothetical protein
LFTGRLVSVRFGKFTGPEGSRAADEARHRDTWFGGLNGQVYTLLGQVTGLGGQARLCQARQVHWALGGPELFAKFTTET